MNDLANPRGSTLAAHERGNTDAYRIDPSAIRLLRPLLGSLTYLGIRTRGHRLPVYMYYDHGARDRIYGRTISLRHARDWRGRQQTYEGHPGTDFVVPRGTRIVAPAAGIVRRVGAEPLGGNYLWIDHGGGYGTSYHHLSSSIVAVGQEVARGDLLAYSGASGWILTKYKPWIPPHLHFNLTINGLPIDPFPSATPWGYGAFWIGEADPRPWQGQPEKAALLAMELRSKTEALLLAKALDPVLFANYQNAMDFFAPDALSIAAAPLDCPVELSLPFSATDFTGLA
ncbi:MAG: M23 family metallopeptidase [Cyanobacteria bacterium NC_groundwater_1444_Ag_S-0.65um_54_12]|nr:M23 family metallopeptidase [Cyanobacteria bacterium NC_groundwater_1444_Ag_S-0.65um_54_12]